MRRLTYDRSREVQTFVRAQFAAPPAWNPDAVAIGVEKDGQIIGGVVLEGFTQCDVNLHMAGVGRWATPELIVRVFHYAFVILRLRRVTALVRAKNANSLAICHKMGFTVEGVKRHAFVDDDLIVLGMTREECRFLGKQP